MHVVRCIVEKNGIFKKDELNKVVQTEMYRDYKLCKDALIRINRVD